MNIAVINPVSEVERMIVNFIEQKQKHLHYHKMKTDAEKEYNKLLANSGGEDKIFSIEQADKIYKAYQQILINEEQSKLAEDKFNESYARLQELGRILFYANITTEINLAAFNGNGPLSKTVTVSFPNGEVFVA